jgi:hypothetical protein
VPNIILSVNTFKIYLWLGNSGIAPDTLTVNGMSTSKTASDLTDFTVNIPGGSTIDADNVGIQVLTIVKSTVANMVTVTLNGGAVRNSLILKLVN